MAAADSMTRIFPHGQPVFAAAGKFSVSAARGEEESLQLIILAPADKELASAAVTAGQVAAVKPVKTLLPQVKIVPVGFVKTKTPRYTVEYTGWHPDLLLAHLKEITILADEAQPFWVKITVPSECTGGDYQAEIKVRINSKEYQVPLSIKVWDFSLPRTGHFPTFTSLYNMPDFIADEEDFDSLRMFLLGYRLSFGNIYSGGGYGKAFNDLRPAEPYMIKKYTDHGLVNFNITYLRLKRQVLHDPPITGEKSVAAWESLPESERTFYPQAEKERIKKILGQWIPKLKTLGIYNRAYCYGFDEATRSEWPAFIDFWKYISVYYPDLKIYTTAVDPSLGQDSGLDFVSGFIVNNSQYNYEAACKARKRGIKVLPYNARLCIDTPLIQQRDYLGFHAWRMKFDGYFSGILTAGITLKKGLTADHIALLKI